VAVKIKLLAGAGAAQTSFADTFNRASGPLGSDWIVASYPFLPTNTVVATMEANVGVATDLGQACLIAFIGNANPTWVLPCQMIPILVSRNLFGLNAFCQATFISGADNSLAGIGLGLKTDTTLSFYSLANSTNGNTVTIRKWVAGALSTLATVRASKLVANEVIRFWVNYDDPAQVVLNATIDGGSLTTVADAAASRFYDGSPGILGISTNQTGTQQYRNFSCGLGT